MLGIGHVWQRYLQCLGLIVLALNIMLVSIPRCDLVFSVLQHHWTQATEVHDEEQSCHDSSVPHDSKAKAFTSDRICECSVFKFMAFNLPQMSLHEYVYFHIQSERLLTFPWKAFLTQFHPLLEPPYPKA